jgi:hypothetical protein
MALIEALIDFGEDENIEDDVYDNGETTHGYFSLRLQRATEWDTHQSMLDLCSLEKSDCQSQHAL